MSVADNDKLYDGDKIRCPKCGYTRSVADGDNSWHLYEEGWHKTYCYDCDYEFEVLTSVRHTFTSPKRI